MGGIKNPEGECGDRWERFSGRVSSLSMALLPTLLFVLIMSYVIVVGLQNANFTFTVNGEQVTFRYPSVAVPINYGAVKNAVIYLFGAIVLGLPIPLLSGKLEPLKIAVSLVQAGAFVYGLYTFVSMIIQLANSLA